MPRSPDVKTARREIDAANRKIEADGLPHSEPGTLDQDLEDSFPASDPPSYSGSQSVGTPKGHDTTPPLETESGGLAAGPDTISKKVDSKADRPDNTK